MSLSNLEHDSQLVQAIYSLYRFLAVFSSIKLNWCPGHKGILGIELANFFAKQSYAIYKKNILQNTPDHFRVKVIFKSAFREKWQNKWNNSIKGRLTREFLPSYVSNTYDHKLTQILSGHCRLNYYLHLIDAKPSPLCRCLQGIESVDHYLFFCTKEDSNRQKTLLPACRILNLQFPPAKHQITSDILLFRALKLFLRYSSRLNIDEEYK